MAVSITLTFDDAWAARLVPVIRKWAGEIERNPIVRALLDARGVTSVDDLNTVQQAKLVWLASTLWKAQLYEGDAAERVARDAIKSDLEQNFPLEIG